MFIFPSSFEVLSSYSYCFRAFCKTIITETYGGTKLLISCLENERKQKQKKTLLASHSPLYLYMRHEEFSVNSKIMKTKC